MAQARPRGWWYPYIFVAGFGVVILVNMALAYFATSTFTGLSTEQPYEKGLAYNTNLAMAKAQAELGWTVETRVRPIAEAGQVKAEIRVSYLGKDGKGIEGLAVKAQVIRPTSKGYDHEITLAPLGMGIYGGTYVLPLNGVWDLDIAALGKDVAYEHAQRIVLP